MKIMNEYTYHQIKQNKRHTFSILTAVMIASALLFSLCIFAYSFWRSKVDEAITLSGNWHGELYAAIRGDKLQDVIDYPDVESVMVKGNWYTAKLPDGERPYLLFRDANDSFWRDMNLKNSVMEGDVPHAEGEIVVAKQFFLDNPQYQVGDSISLPVGNRMLGDKALETRAYRSEGETFDVTGYADYKIVGKLDVSGASAYPGYIAMGYLDFKDIQPTDELTVYLRLEHPRRIYTELPLIAEAAGLEKNSKGLYDVLYNSSMLVLMGIADKGTINLQILVLIVMALIVLILVSGTFILIIYNAFAMSANSRVKELSILKSIGATPKQIKYSVLYEGFLLWLVQAPIGIIIGYIFSHLIVKQVNRILSVTEYYVEMKLAFSWIVVLAALIISLITVLISAAIPAGRMAKVPAVEGINSLASYKKMRDHKLLFRMFKMEGELAGRQFTANRKSLRTAILSLALCIMLVISYLSIITIYNIAENKDSAEIEYDLSANLYIMEEPDEELLRGLTDLNGTTENVVRRQVSMATMMTREQESEEFCADGGFPSVDLKYSLTRMDNQYRVNVQLIGLDRPSFEKYCEKVGVNPESYGCSQNSNSTEHQNSESDADAELNETARVKGILYNAVMAEETYSGDYVEIPLVAWENGDSMHLMEEADDLSKGDYECDIEIDAVTAEEPGMASIDRYGLGIIVPMETYQALTAHFSSERALEAGRMSIDYKTENRDSTKVKAEIEKLCNYYLGTDDYSIWSLMEDEAYRGLKQKSTGVVVYAIALMFGVIGLFNACATITNNLLVHKREYAMLRSIGLTPAGLNKMLFLEGTLFVISPIILSIPVVLLVSKIMMNMTSTSLSEYMAACPIGVITLYLLAMITIIFLAYLISSAKIKRNNVIESIQNEIA